eukprot:COSAG01_NODE_12574_length_1717_cov_1.755871_1_plen_183_part_00
MRRTRQKSKARYGKKAAQSHTGVTDDDDATTRRNLPVAQHNHQPQQFFQSPVIVTVAAVIVMVVLLGWCRRDSMADTCPCGNMSWASPRAQAIERFGYARGCDFDVLDDMPPQTEFDARYWNKRPVLIRNGTKAWPARAKWSKSYVQRMLSREDFGMQWFSTSDEWVPPKQRQHIVAHKLTV